MREDDIQTTNNILDLSSSLEFNNSGVIKGEIEIDNIFELENNIEILVQDKIIEPTKEMQIVMVDEDYDQLGTVTVNPIPDEYIIPDGTLDVDANGDVDVTMFRMARVGVYTPPVLQDKLITIIENGTTNIVADEGYDGLNSVEVIADVKPTPPEIGFVVHEWNSSGKPVVLEYVGMEKISGTPVYTGNITEIILPSTTTSIGDSAFYNYTNLEKITMSDNVKSIGQSAFENCRKLILNKLPDALTGSLIAKSFTYCEALAIKTIPDGITKIAYSALSACNSITQLSMKNVKTIEGSNTGNSGFASSTGIIAVWMGSAITSSGFSRYSYSGCTSLRKLFIDLPRATVETFTNYQYAFMNDTSKTGIIVCNDDEGFMTKEEFDAINWSNYTE